MRPQNLNDKKHTGFPGRLIDADTGEAGGIYLSFILFFTG